ncbi:hypothetical protein JOC77_000993 [Peribacillus deserti]|uniref:Uncharacterized protein n=1 Tax=Peribacillus deserti TaxID=673318 RepID=A0ABS2QH41_9BACI|nr:hypothetical protein [Peribacillus deserti]
MDYQKYKIIIKGDSSANGTLVEEAGKKQIHF